MVDYIIFTFIFTDKKTRVGGVDIGSVGLVETRVFFFFFFFFFYAELNETS